MTAYTTCRSGTQQASRIVIRPCPGRGPTGAATEALLAGERAVGDLVEQMDIHQSGVSRHLRILESAGFVTVRPEGARRIYALRPEPFREIDTWVNRYRALWTARLDAFGEALARKQQARRPSRPARRTS